MGRLENLMDVPFVQGGPLIWWARRRKIGDKVLVWSYWRREWYRAVIKSEKSAGNSYWVDNIDIINSDGSFCEEMTQDYRMRPRWWGIFKKAAWLGVNLSLLWILGPKWFLLGWLLIIGVPIAIGIIIVLSFFDSE